MTNRITPFEYVAHESEETNPSKFIMDHDSLRLVHSYKAIKYVELTIV